MQLFSLMNLLNMYTLIRKTRVSAYRGLWIFDFGLCGNPASVGRGRGGAEDGLFPFLLSGEKVKEPLSPPLPPSHFPRRREGKKVVRESAINVFGRGKGGNEICVLGKGGRKCIRWEGRQRKKEKRKEIRFPKIFLGFFFSLLFL